MEKTVEWIDCWDKERPDKEGVYFITRGNPPYSEEAAYDPEAGEFVGYDEEDYIVAWSPDTLEPYKGDGSKSDEMWNIYPDDPPEEYTTLLVTCENAVGDRFIQHAVVMKGKLRTGDSYMWPLKPYLKVVAWMDFPEPYRGRV